MEIFHCNKFWGEKNLINLLCLYHAALLFLFTMVDAKKSHLFKHKKMTDIKPSSSFMNFIQPDFT